MSVKNSSIKTKSFRILFLDDEPSLLQLYSGILRVAPVGIRFDVTCCTRAEEALEVFREAMDESRPFSVAFLDIHMPEGRDGVWAAEEIRKLDPNTGIVMVTGDVDGNLDEVERRVPPPDKLFYLAKPFNSKEIRQFSLALCSRWEAEREVLRTHGHLETRDPYTAGHQNRVALLSRAIGEEMGLSSDQILGIYMAAQVHDIGKISVPSEFLTKPGRLSKPEMELIRCHPQEGYDILKDIPFPWSVTRFVVQHHERMDGSGYPLGLSGEEIAIEARILAVADVVEAMASDRPYRPALGLTIALEEISKNSGKFYDPQVANACVSLFKDKQFILPTAQSHTPEKV